MATSLAVPGSRSSVRTARRWRIRLAITLVALVALRAAWHYRPLTEIERKLVGTWLIQTQSWSMSYKITLTPDRRFRTVWIGTDPQIVTMGSWSVSGDTYSMRPDIPWDLRPSLLWIARRWISRSPPSSVTFRDADQLEMKGPPGGPTWWQRVTSEPVQGQAMPAEVRAKRFIGHDDVGPGAVSRALAPAETPERPAQP